MGDQQGSDASDQGPDLDPGDLTASLASIARRSQDLVTKFLTDQASPPLDNGARPANAVDPLNIGTAFFEMTSRLARNPETFVEAQMGLWQDYLSLWQHTARRMIGEDSAPVIEPDEDDRRFRDESWNENLLFDFLKQSYLLTARWIRKTVSDVDGMDAKSAQKVDFYTRQFVDALAPSNFAMTNPEVLRRTFETGGENLIKGLENLLGDLERGKGQLRISQTDEDAFDVGGNLAITPGEVIYRDELFELLHYKPTTENVARRPLLIVPPWINKYYILDLNPKKSFIAWCLDQGLSVYVISWVNPEPALADKSFEDYMTDGLLAALDVVQEETGEERINAVGYCLGGTLLAATLAHMAAVGDERIATATFLVAMIDFTEAGELGVFIDEEQLQSLEAQMDETGYLDGGSMATTFNMLRANDLIWSFVVNNYLLGQDPFPFDLLYWNSDSTRMPAAMHSYYLRRMYQENKLAEPDGLTLGGQPIDLARIKIPTFFLSTQEDHIAPWKSTYTGMNHFSGTSRFCLAGSGHIAGVVNPPAAQKYSYWDNAKTPKEADRWFDGAVQHDGSWWPSWRAWLKRRDGGQVPARHPGKGPHKSLGPAPGTYVLVRGDEDREKM